MNRWLDERRQMSLDPTVTMLNTGSFGPTPTPVFEACLALRRRLAPGPTDFFLRQVPPLLWASRERTAAFLGSVPQRFVFATNVSLAINMIADGIELAAPGELLISDHEYGAMIWTWERAAQRLGLTIRTFPVPKFPQDAGEVIDAAKAAMTPRTRLFFFSHIVASTGTILPAKELCAEARKRGILSVVDGAHAPALLDLNIGDIGADFYAGNLHKWLLAPIGAGFMTYGPGMEDRLPPLWVSWGYRPDSAYMPNAAAIHPDARDQYGSTPRTRALEFVGTMDVCPWLSVPEAIDFHAALGWTAIRAKHQELAEFARTKFAELLGWTLATPPGPTWSGPMTAFEVPAGIDPFRLRERLWERRIEIAMNVRPDRALLRVSHHWYTTEDEIERLVLALKEVSNSD